MPGEKIENSVAVTEPAAASRHNRACAGQAPAQAAVVQERVRHVIESTNAFNITLRRGIRESAEVRRQVERRESRRRTSNHAG